MTLEAVREVCSQDVADEEDVLALRADRERLARDAAPLLIGNAMGEFRRHDDQFRQRCFAFERSRDRAEVGDGRQGLRKAVAAMDRILEKAKRVERGIRVATATYDAFDRRSVSGDPRSVEVYEQTSEHLASMRVALGRGELERSSAILDQVDRDLETLAAQADQVRRDAAAEVELWGRIALICPATAAAFATELAGIPLQPAGDALAAWLILRRSIENIVNHSARETRSANAEALHDQAAQYEWRDADERRLRNFAMHAYRAWGDAVSGPIENPA
jgi:hypothetical protein